MKKSLMIVGTAALSMLIGRLSLHAFGQGGGGNMPPLSKLEIVGRTEYYLIAKWRDPNQPVSCYLLTAGNRAEGGISCVKD